MSVVWYPGHMQKARRLLKKEMTRVDLVIEVLDARIPFSSENPLVSELTGTRPCLKILNKSDLADPKITKTWLTALAEKQGVTAHALTARDLKQARKLIALCRSRFPNSSKSKAIRIMVMGIPNVGKSTLINTLAGRGITKVGNEPAITRHQQRIDLDNGIWLNDTPGILWPRMESEESGYCLAMVGSIKNSAMDYEDVGHFASAFLMKSYAGALMRRYEFKKLPESTTALLEGIGQKRGCLRSGGMIDLHKSAIMLLQDLQRGALGRISLETPPKIENTESALP